MNQNNFKLIAGGMILLVGANPGYAAMRPVCLQAAVVNDRLTRVHNDTNAQAAPVAANDRAGVSRVQERIDAIDNQLETVVATADEASATAGKAHSTASQAVQQGEADAGKIRENSLQLSIMAAAQDYYVAATGNVMFDVNSSALTDESKAVLEALIQKATTSPRTMFELVGFADTTGSKDYNLALSQKRAGAVARYLVGKGIPTRNISLIGLGDEQTPEQLAAEVQELAPDAGPKELQGLARRVRVRLYMPGTPDVPQRASN